MPSRNHNRNHNRLHADETRARFLEALAKQNGAHPASRSPRGGRALPAPRKHLLPRKHG